MAGGSDYTPGGAPATGPSTSSWTDYDAALWGIGAADANLPVQYGRNKPKAKPSTGFSISAPGATTGIPFKQEKQPLNAPLAQILQTLSSVEPAQLAKLQAKLKAGGYIGPQAGVKWGTPDETTVAGFTKLLQTTSRLTQAGQDRTWQEVLASSVNPDAATSAAMKAAGLSATGAHNETTKSTTLTDAKSAEAVVTAAFKDAMGRMPTAAEKAKFLKHLNAQESSHPTVTKTHYDAQGNATSQSTSGGLGAAGTSQLATDQAMKNPDYANYQAAAFYTPLLFQALGASTDLEGGL